MLSRWRSRRGEPQETPSLGWLAVAALGFCPWTVGAPQPWADKGASPAVVEAIASFFGTNLVRYPGSPGNLAIEAAVENRFAQSGYPSGAIRFVAPVLIPGPAWLHLDQEGSPIRLWAMHPTVFRPSNFDARTFDTSLVYLGRGTPADLQRVHGVDLRGALAVMEFDCGTAWLSLLRLGLRGFLFLDTGPHSSAEAAQKMYNSEVRVPRYWVEGSEADRLRGRCRAGPVPARVEAEPTRWRSEVLRNLWVLIPGADPNRRKDIAVIVAPMDSNAIVPEKATGAQSALNLFLLLRLLDTFAARPPACSVLLVAVNAHTQAWLGERLLAWHLLVPEVDVEALRDVVAADLRVAEVFVRHYAQVRLDGTADEEDAAWVERLRTLTVEAAGKPVTVKDPLVALARRDVNELKARYAKLSEQVQTRRRAVSTGSPDPELPKLERELEELGRRRDRHGRVLTLFNRFGIRTTLSELDPQDIAILRTYVQEVLSHHRQAAALHLRDLDWSAANSAIRTALDGGRVRVVLVLAFTAASPEVAFSSKYGAPVTEQRRWEYRWGTTTTRIAAALPEVREGRHPNRLVDTLTHLGGFPEHHHILSGSLLLAVFHAADRTAAFQLVTPYSDSLRAFTTSDTLAHLNADAAAELLAYVPTLLRAIFDDPQALHMEEGNRPAPFQRSWSAQIKTHQFDPYAASVLPQLPVPHTALVVHQRHGLLWGDVVAFKTALTDERASAVIVGLHEDTRVFPVSITAFRFDPDFVRVEYAIDAGEAAAKVPPDLLAHTHRVLALFPCVEFPIFDLADSSLIAAAPIRQDKFLLLSAARNSAPRRYGFSGAASVLSRKTPVEWLIGPAAFYAEPGERIKLLTQAKRAALNASASAPEGIGFVHPEEIGPAFFETVTQDLGVLNRYRLSRLRGVTDDLAVSFLTEADTAAQATEQARREHRHLDELRTASLALGAQAKAYRQITSTTNDMLKAVVFYMALVLPFCFFLEKLLFKTVRIEAEMGWFALLFVLTFLLFRFIHPAFRVAQYPEAIFIAFVMGALGLFVIGILHGRFEGEMRLLLTTFGNISTLTASYSMAGQQALLIGVNNMKRRRIRTTLTTATVVLVTFTMLAFTSISRKMHPTLVAKSQAPLYPGLFFSWPGNSRMDEETCWSVERLFAGRAQIIVRRWLLPAPPWGGGPPAPFRVHGPTGQPAMLDAVLGLPAEDNGFLKPLPLIAGRFFSSNDAPEVVLPATLAAALGVTADQVGHVSVRFCGHGLQVVGILDDEGFRAIHDICGRPLIPIKDLIRQDTGLVRAEEQIVEETDAAGVFYAETSALILMPVETSRRFGARPYSLSIRFPPEASVWEAARDLLLATSAKFYLSSPIPFSVGGQRETSAGVYYVGAGYRTSIGGLGRLIIPLLIAATIILNTMLGSVYERKREIAVYNAVGLNPTHIALFFLAESFVYSVLGSVGGYLIGQVLSLALTRFGWVREVNLNFSSLSVAYVILFTVSVVLLSTVYPAVMATRAAVPSGRRRWSLPPHDGLRMQVVFPFIYQSQIAPGIMQYLEDFFAQFTEASTAEWLATPMGRTRSVDAQGRPVYGLHYQVALPPYDLGVTQEVHFQAAYDPLLEAYRIHLAITRLSGQDTNWVTTNRPFLERLRIHLLQWRNLTAADHLAFARRGTETFESAGESLDGPTRRS